jgi:hypothetical protein
MIACSCTTRQPLLPSERILWDLDKEPGQPLELAIDGSPIRRRQSRMEVFEIRPLGGDGRCVLTGPLGIVERLGIDTIREAALHAQFCAHQEEAIDPEFLQRFLQ